MTAEPLGRLLASAQSALADVPTVPDYRAKELLVESAKVQALCAQAVANHSLAESVARLVDAITTEETP